MAVSKGKLLLVTRDVDGGIGRHFVDLAAGMADRGWKVHCVRAAGVEGHVTDHSARLDALAGVTVHEIPLARSIGLGDLRSYLAFRRIVKQHGPFDIAHGHGAKGGVLARLPCRDIKASVYTPHGLITLDKSSRGPKSAMYGAIESFLARLFTDAMILVSAGEKEEAQRLGAPDRICHVVPNALAKPDLLGKTEARKQIGLPCDADIALFVGRFAHAKAPERFISLIARLAQGRPTLQGLLIGSHDGRADLEVLASKAGVSDRLTFFKTERAASYMPAADVLIIPSRYEGLAYSMIEGLAAGLPIVSYDVPGATMGITDGENGFIVPQAEEGKLAAATTAVLDHPERRAKMAAASLSRFPRFSLPKMIDSIDGVYRSLTETAPAGIALQKQVVGE